MKKILIITAILITSLSCQKQQEIKEGSSFKSDTETVNTAPIKKVEKDSDGLVGVYSGGIQNYYFEIIQKKGVYFIKVGRPSQDEYSKKINSDMDYNIPYHKLDPFLGEFTIDISKPLEMLPMDINNEQYYFVPQLNLYFKGTDTEMGIIPETYDKINNNLVISERVMITPLYKEDYPNLNKLKFKEVDLKQIWGVE